MRSRFFVFRRLVLAVLLPGVLLVPLAAGQPRAQKGSALTTEELTNAKPGRDPKQPIDEEYTRKIKEHTTETFFLSPPVDYLPASKTVPTPKAVLGDIAGAAGKLPYTKEIHQYMRLLAKATPRVKVYSILKAKVEGPAAYVFPATDPRPGSQAELLRVLQKQAVEISRATSAFTVTVPARPAATGRGGRGGRGAGANAEGDEQLRRNPATLIPPQFRPRVAVRFEAQNSLLVSGLLDGGADIAQRPVVVDVPVGKGHVVLFANNPIWRGSTIGSYFLVFNALLNHDSLDAGRTLDSR